VTCSVILNLVPSLVEGYIETNTELIRLKNNSRGKEGSIDRPRGERENVPMKILLGTFGFDGLGLSVKVKREVY